MKCKPKYKLGQIVQYKEELVEHSFKNIGTMVVSISHTVSLDGGDVVHYHLRNDRVSHTIVYEDMIEVFNDKYKDKFGSYKD